MPWAPWTWNCSIRINQRRSGTGGFTVFGRVLESTNGNPGTDVLRHFNTLSANAGVVNLGTLLGSAYGVFSDLPVSYTNTTTRVPINQEG